MENIHWQYGTTTILFFFYSITILVLATLIEKFLSKTIFTETIFPECI